MRDRVRILTSLGLLGAVDHERHAGSSFTGPVVHKKSQRKIFDLRQYPLQGGIYYGTWTTTL
jgi:hypothetical protein